LKIIILSTAKDDLKEIHGYLSEFGDTPIKKFKQSFIDFISRVEKTPLLYAQYEYNPIYRRAVIEYGYLVFYRVGDDKTIRIYRVLHGKRDVAPLPE